MGLDTETDAFGVVDAVESEIPNNLSHREYQWEEGEIGR